MRRKDVEGALGRSVPHNYGFIALHSGRGTLPMDGAASGKVAAVFDSLFGIKLTRGASGDTTVRIYPGLLLGLQI